MPLRSMILLIALGAVVVGTPAARSESYCIACQGPDATYRCVVADTPEGGPPDPRNQIRCVKELATAGQHQRCSVERFSASGCEGPVRVIANAALDAPEAGVPPEGGSAAPGEGTAPPSGVAKDPLSNPVPPETPKSPSTVAEVAHDTAQATKKGLDGVSSAVTTSVEKAGDGIKDAGSAIGSAAAKTWRCLKSFFDDC